MLLLDIFLAQITALIESTEKPHTEKYKEIINEWKYDANSTLTILLVWNLVFKCFVFVAQSVP